MERETKEGLPYEQYFIRMRSEDNITPSEITQIALIIRSIYTAVWLVEQNRRLDFVIYSNSWNPKFEEETGLQVEQTNKTSAGDNSVSSVLELRVPRDHNPEVIKKVFGILEDISQKE